MMQSVPAGEGVFMDTNDVMRAMVSHAGLSSRAASAALGRSPSWLSATLARPGSSEAATVAQLADACGYVLAAVPAGAPLPPGSMVIDPRPAG